MTKCRTWPGSVARTHLSLSIPPPAPTKKRHSKSRSAKIPLASRFSFRRRFSCRQTHCLQHFVCASRSRMFRMDSKQFFRLVIKLLFYFCNFALQAEGGNVGGTARDDEAAIWRAIAFAAANAYTPATRKVSPKVMNSLKFKEHSTRNIYSSRPFFVFVKSLKSFSRGALWARCSYVWRTEFIN